MKTKKPIYKSLTLKDKYNIGFINQDFWEVEHESDDDIRILSIGHNIRFAKILTGNLSLGTSLANAEIISDAPVMLTTIKNTMELLINTPELYDKIPAGTLKSLTDITNKYYKQ
jgi:hypothetical protein